MIAGATALYLVLAGLLRCEGVQEVASVALRRAEPALEDAWKPGTIL
jgi:hypothetical protein